MLGAMRHETVKMAELGKLTSTDELNSVRNIFEAYCKPKHELSVWGFKRMLRDMRVYSRGFLAIDAEIAFDKTLAIVSVLDASDPLHHNIIFGKRIEFNIFWLFLLTETAELRGVSVDELLNFFDEANLHKFSTK
jgi:hypothetical protein